MPVVKPEVKTLEHETVAPEFTSQSPRNLELLGLIKEEWGNGVWQQCGPPMSSGTG